jgi:hypothetical protein
MRYKLGRMLQLLGMLILPIGIAGNLARPEQFKESFTLQMAMIGIAVFFVGWLVQKGTTPN